MAERVRTGQLPRRRLPALLFGLPTNMRPHSTSESLIFRPCHRAGAAFAADATASSGRLGGCVGLRRMVLSLSLGLAACASNDDGNPPVARLIAFGDSFTDQGNYRSVADAAGVPDAGRFTTNPDPMWIEHVASRLGVDIRPSADGGTNYAEGFARNALPAPAQPGLSQRPIRDQIERFIANDGFAAGDVVLINGGGNDVLLALQAGGEPAPLDQAARDFADGIGTLVDAGAPEIYLLRTPDIGLAPVGGSGTGGAANPLSRLVAHYNEAVERELDSLLQRSEDTIRVLDPGEIITTMFNSPESFGLVDVVTPACTNGDFAAFACGPSSQLPGASESYFVADQIHLAGRAQRVLGDYLADRINRERSNDED